MFGRSTLLFPKKELNLQDKLNRNEFRKRSKIKSITAYIR